ncbi:MAG: hypothetical protein OXG98_07525 [Gemmatimonadetes bacterium]|nr:hypothetical protein [Gemmatimonadota bacterium]
MMEMLKLFRLAVCVVCIAAFASGCGGGGGGTAEEMPPVMECPQGQVGTYPDCTDPPPTDAELIADAQDTIAGILTDAQTRVGAARSAAAAVRAHADATVDQIANANSNLADAESALAAILTASGVANAATTPAQANGAVADARTALGVLTTAESAVASILSAVNAVAEARRQREANEIALTNGSRLIQHIRDNKLLSDALLDDLEAARLLVGPVGATTRTDADTEDCTAPCATFPANTGTGTTRVTGQRTVRVPVGSPLVSDSTTPTLGGPSRFSNGFDLKNADGTTYVNAYTDITQTKLKQRTRTNVLEDTDLSDGDDRYTETDIEDADYLLAGIWMTVDNAALGNSTIQAFAYGSQPIPAAPTLCSGLDGPTSPATSTSGVTTTTRTCTNPTEFNQIDSFVDDGQDVTATYTGDANGAYIAGGDTSYFTGSVELTAEFKNPTGGTDDGTGSIGGAVTNIVAGGQQLAGSIELQKQTLGNDISTVFDSGMAVGVVDNKSFSGNWKGQFFGMRYTRTQATTTDRTNPADIQTTITTTYSPQHPGSVAGTFYATQQSNPAGSAAFIGAFGANR